MANRIAYVVSGALVGGLLGALPGILLFYLVRDRPIFYWLFLFGGGTGGLVGALAAATEAICRTLTERRS
jgi:hypothetical protein